VPQRVIAQRVLPYERACWTLFKAVPLGCSIRPEIQKMGMTNHAHARRAWGVAAVRANADAITTASGRQRRADICVRWDVSGMERVPQLPLHKG
jgi:hypothetical protein